MKLHRLIFLTIAIGSLHSLAAQPAALKMTPAGGRTQGAGERFVISAGTRIACSEALQPLAAYLAECLGLKMADRRYTGDNTISLILSERHGAGDAGHDGEESPEAYSITAAPSYLQIDAGDYGGAFNGVQALLRMLPAQVYAGQCPLPVEIPCGTADDAPRFGYRGMMLDVSRTWIGADEVKRYIDLFSYHNINKLHLHLSDDEGWRIEIKSHPELTQIGGFRGGDSPVRAVYGKWDQKYGGYFTQEQMRDLIGYATVRNIEIIPEIDLPGHSRNIASVHPEIRCDYPPDTVSANGYDYRSAWCAAREENYALLADILGELCELFPSQYIHIGGDEVDMEQWEQCPDCKALMRREAISGTQQLQEYFMARLIDILATHGKRPAVWNEAAASGRMTRQSRVHGWQGVKECLDATAKGYRTVVMPGQYFYFDMRQTPTEDGHDWAAIFDARKVYGFDFAALGFSAEQMKHVAGLQGAFFSEAYVSHHPEKPDYLDYMLFPRVCALARLAWNGNAEGWEKYYGELVAEHYERMTAMGIHFRLFPPKVAYKDGELTAAADDGSEIFYLEGDNAGLSDTPDLWSAAGEQRYDGPIKTGKPHLYRFYTRRGTGQSPLAADKSYYRTIAPAVTITTSMGESAKFPYANASTYKGLSRTMRACRQQDWILYTFAAPVKCREMYLQTGNKQLPKTILTTGYAEVSYDGVRFEPVGELEKGSITLRSSQPVRAVRLVATCDDNGTPYVTIQPPQVKPVL